MRLPTLHVGRKSGPPILLAGQLYIAGFPMSPSSSFENLLEWLVELGEMLT